MGQDEEEGFLPHHRCTMALGLPPNGDLPGTSPGEHLQGPEINILFQRASFFMIVILCTSVISCGLSCFYNRFSCLGSICYINRLPPLGLEKRNINGMHKYCMFLAFETPR